MEANAFDLLRDWSREGKTFDTIVLDPPAFAKSKRAVEGAVRGYKELNLRALKMLRPNGTLVTCSCSHHISQDEFQGVVAECRGGCPAPPAYSRTPRSFARPSRHPQHSGDGIPEVPDPHGRLILQLFSCQFHLPGQFLLTSEDCHLMTLGCGTARIGNRGAGNPRNKCRFCGRRSSGN